MPAYTPTVWVNTPSGGTNVKAADLNHMEAGIKAAHDAAAEVALDAAQVALLADAAQEDADAAAVTAAAAQATADAAQPKSLVTTKGDLMVATGANTFDRHPVGANDRVLLADSGATRGVTWGVTIQVADSLPSPSGYLDGDILFIRKS